MRNAGRGDVWKPWGIAAVVIGFGAWISPVLYNAGKALAEVSQGKTMNGALEWLARVCEGADFPDFQRAALWLAWILGMVVWMQVLRTRREIEARLSRVRQLLWGNPQGPRQCVIGFVLGLGSLVVVVEVLIAMGWMLPRAPGGGFVLWALAGLGGAWGAALVMEVMFRGVALGIFLRGASPWVAIVISAVFFASVFHFIPDGTVNVADPEAGGIGFELLRIMAGRLLDWRVLVCDFLPTTLLGAGLALVRWKTASLWMAVGAYAGWRFGKSMIATVSSPHPDITLISADCMQHALIPVLAILVASAAAYWFLRLQTHESNR